MREENKPSPRVEKMTKAVMTCNSLEELKVVWSAMNEEDRKAMQSIFTKRRERVCKTTEQQS